MAPSALLREFPERDVELQYVDVWLAQEAGGAELGVVVDQLPDLGDVQAVVFGHPLDLDGRVLRGGVRVDRGGGAGDRVPEAAYDLAELYNSLRRPALRDHWYRIAAEAGHQDACNEMGWLTEYHRDYQEAERWYVRAAEDVRR